MKAWLASRGFDYGSGLLSPDCSKFLINIPKNASSFMLNWATSQGWQPAIVGDNCEWFRCKETVVVLRDPVQRWISGIAQYIHGWILGYEGPNNLLLDAELRPPESHSCLTVDQFISQYNQVSENLIFDMINRLDDHVWPQTEFFQDIMPLRKRTFFYLDQNFQQRVSESLGWPVIENLDRNSKEDNQDIARLQDFFAQQLAQRPDLMARVKLAYAQDYCVVNAVLKPQSLG